MKKVLTVLSLLLALLMVFGVVGPALVSAKDSLAVGAGFAVVLIAFGVVIWGAKRLNIDWSRFGLAVAVLIMAGGLSACDNVPVGNIGIKVNKLGGDKGVSQETLTPGRYWIGMNEELFLFPTFTTTDTYDGKETIAFQTKEGMQVSADVGITFAYDPEKIPTLFQKFRKGSSEISDIYLRRNVQDAFSELGTAYDTEAVYSTKKTELVAAVEQRVKDNMKPLGILVENVYVIGAVKLPPQVVAALNAKVEATQQAQQRQNEVATAKAEADKKIEAARGEAESITLRANAQAEANRKLAQSLTPTLVQYTALQKWNGELPKLTGTGAIPLIDLK